jgi:hypothetical protein
MLSSIVALKKKIQLYTRFFFFFLGQWRGNSRWIGWWCVPSPLLHAQFMVGVSKKPTLTLAIPAHHSIQQITTKR